jgi:predicted small metal-binding protein
VSYQQTCPRCGDELIGDEKEAVADAVVEHALSAHRHALDRDIVLAHLDGRHPHDGQG